MCAVRPVKAAGAKPWDLSTVGEEAGESPVYAERAKRAKARHAAPETQPLEEPDVTPRWSISDVLPPPFKQLTRTR